MLQHIQLYDPDLAPRPVSAALDADPPTVTMTVIPGSPLSGRLTPSQTDALLGALNRPCAGWMVPTPVLVQQKPSVTVLGHRDPYLSNYLWDGTRVRIVDFEDSCLSDPATEIAILIEHLSTRDSGLHPGLFDVDPVRLLAARRVWAMFWLWRLLPGGPSEHLNPPGAADLQAHRLLGLLD